MTATHISEKAQKFQQQLILTAKGSHGAKDMDRNSAKEALHFLLSGEANEIQMAAFITAMRFKGAEIDELLGFTDAIMENSIQINPKVDNLVSCGAPYDGRKKSLHLSCAAAIIAVAAGVQIIIHSSTGLPPKNGVTAGDVLESLGIPAYLKPDEVEARIEHTGFGFLHASRFVPALEKFRRVRETLIYRNFIHTCETINNPANAKRVIIGAAHVPFLQKLTSVVRIRGAEHIMAVKGLDGSDEVPLKPVKAVEFKEGKTAVIELSPASYNLPEQTDAAPQTAATTASIILDTLHNKREESKNAIVYNAGIRIYVGGKANSISEGVDQAREILGSGKALKTLENIKSYQWNPPS